MSAAEKKKPSLAVLIGMEKPKKGEGEYGHKGGDEEEEEESNPYHDAMGAFMDAIHSKDVDGAVKAHKVLHECAMGSEDEDGEQTE